MRQHLPSRPAIRAILVMATSGSVVAAGLVAAPSASAEELTATGIWRAGPAPDLVVEEVDAEPVVVEELTTPTSTTSQLPDGSYSSVVYPVPVNYRDKTGDWRPIDNTLVPAVGDDWAVENAAADYSVKLPEDASVDPVRFSADGQWVSFALRGADGAPRVREDAATFDTATPGTDVTYEAMGAGVKESIELIAAPDQPTSYVFDVAASSGLRLRLSDAGGIDVVDGAGDLVFAMAAPFMVDSASPALAESTDVSYDLASTAQGWTVAMTPSQEWLTAPERVYPVVIDPTITLPQASVDTYLVNGDEKTTAHNGAGWDYLRVGTTSTGDKSRALLRFDLSQVPRSATVTRADLQLALDETKTSRTALTDYGVYRPGKAWTGSATWVSPDGSAATAWVGGNPAANPATGSAYAIRTLSGNNGGVKHWYPTALVGDYVKGTRLNTGFLVKQESETVDSLLAFHSSNANNRALWPALTVDYTESNVPAASTAGERKFYKFDTHQLTDRMQAKVNVANGNMILTGTDANVAGAAGLNLAVQRFYNSALTDATDPSKLGAGWSTGLGGSVRLEFADGGTERVFFYGVSGYRTRFDQNVAGTYLDAEPGIDATLEYDSSNNTYRLEWYSKSVYVFNAAGRLTAMRDKQGNEITFTYAADANGAQLLDYATDTRGRKADFTYNAAGLLAAVEIQTPSGTPLLRYAYTYTADIPAQLASSRVSYVATGDGSALPDTADSVNIDAETQYIYDGLGRLKEVIDARETEDPTNKTGGTTLFAYNADGKVASVTRTTDSTDLPNSTTSYTYTNDGATNADCSTNPNSKTRTVVDAERTDVSDTTTYCADSDGRVVRTVDANGHVRSTKYGPNSNVAEADMSGLGSGGQVSQYNYNDKDQLTGVETPTGGQASLQYGDAANPNAPTGVYDFSTGGNTSGAATWSYDYDDKGNLIEAKSPGASITYRYCWDGDGQLQRIDAPAPGGGTSTALDTDPNNGCGYADQGNDTLLSYDADGHQTKADRPGPHGTVTYTYDALSRVKTMTDGRGVRTTYTYDALDHVTQVVYDDDPTDAVSGPTQTATVQWTYDQVGNLLGMDDPSGHTTFAYDELNRRTVESPQAPSSKKYYSYDPAGNLLTSKVSDEPAPTVYTYDKVNLVTSVDDQRSTSNVATFGYDRRDKRTKTVYPVPGANVVQEARYDDGGKLQCIYSYRTSSAPTNDDKSCPSATFSGLLTFYQYDYNTPAGFNTNTRYKVTELGGVTTQYAYDSITRLTTATVRSRGGRQLRKFTYEYDNHSNLTRETATGSTPGLQTGTTTMAYNEADEMCWSATSATTTSGTTACGSAPLDATSYTYDGVGALTTGTGGAQDGLQLAYNTLGQTISIDPAGTAGALPMTYDGVTQDRRTQAGDVRMSYGFAGLSAQATNSGQVHAEWFVRDPSGTLVAMVDRNSTEPDLYYLTDGLGSVVATINTNDKVIRYLYEPYGQEIRSWEDPYAGTADSTGSGNLIDTDNVVGGSEDPTLRQPGGADYNPWRYAGGYYDRTTGMLKFGTRYYMPNQARWTQTDPIAGSPGHPLTMNPYLYAAANPCNVTDPTGRINDYDPAGDSGYWGLTGVATSEDSTGMKAFAYAGACYSGGQFAYSAAVTTPLVFNPWTPVLSVSGGCVVGMFSQRLGYDPSTYSPPIGG